MKDIFHSISTLSDVIKDSDDDGLSLYFDTIVSQDKAKIELFRAIDFNLNIKDEEGRNIICSMIDYATGFDNKTDKFAFLEFMKYLLNIGIDANLQDKKGETVLHKAVLKGCPDLVKTLLDVGDARVSIIDNLGRTPLHNSVWADDITNAQRLLRFNKKSLNIADYAGFYPINYACILGFEDLVVYFIEQNSPIQNSNKKSKKTVKFMQKHIKNLDKLNEKVPHEYEFKHRVEELIQNMKDELK
jgi:ankyrin repeat protein